MASPWTFSPFQVAQAALRSHSRRLLVRHAGSGRAPLCASATKEKDAKPAERRAAGGDCAQSGLQTDRRSRAAAVLAAGSSGAAKAASTVWGSLKAATKAVPAIPPAIAWLASSAVSRAAPSTLTNDLAAMVAARSLREDEDDDDDGDDGAASLAGSELEPPVTEAEQRTKKLQTVEADERQAQAARARAETHPAVQLLKARAQNSGSRPGCRSDPFKLGLVVEGGGMRGAVSAGGLQALHDLGLRDVWDSCYGSSAGAINLTYFLSKQRMGVDIYHEDIANPTFCDLRRLLSRDPTKRPALDLNFLLDYIMHEVKPLDWEAVLNCGVPLKVVASCLDTLQPVILGDFEGKEDLFTCLRASAMVPRVAGDPVRHRGLSLVDAAVFEAVPFRAAIADGCTHIIALCTRPPFRRDDRVGRLVDDAIEAIVKRAVLSPSWMKAAWSQEVENLKAFGATPEELLVEALEPGAEKLPALAGCHVFPVFPGSAAMYSPVCIDAPTILHGIAAGRQAVFNILHDLPASPQGASLDAWRPAVQHQQAAPAGERRTVVRS